MSRITKTLGFLAALAAIVIAITLATLGIQDALHSKQETGYYFERWGK